MSLLSLRRESGPKDPDRFHHGLRINNSVWRKMRIWQPHDWEDWVNSLLMARYPLGDYQRVPDTHGGDSGIEGFSCDGCAYQAYSPTEPLSVKARYEAHRDKITGDIEKFIRNRDDLSAILGQVKIRRWLLVVPRHDSAKLVAHGEKKAEQVRAASLDYVESNDFRVAVVTDDYFQRERALLGAAAAIEIHIPTPELDSSEEDLLSAGGPSFLVNLREKTARIPTLDDPNRAEEFKATIMANYVRGQVVLDRLSRDFPEVFEVIIQEKSARSRQLEIESLLATGDGRERVTAEIQSMKETIQSRFPNISAETQTSLAMEALSDWLLTCPLDFPAPPSC